MNDAHYPARCEARKLTAHQRAESQLARLNALLTAVLPTNRFYAQKYAGLKLPLTSFAQFSELPTTTKEELDQAIAGDPAINLTYPIEDYVRVHRTSGTTGRPIYVYDTAADWRWWKEVWQYVLDAANVRASDRALMAFSFGPFIGFWSAADALLHRGAQVIPTGGLSTSARLEMMQDCGATVVCCTPTYALRLAEVARTEQLDLRQCSVEKIIVAGEPGGSLREVRRRIESAWNAQVMDHAGATEIGPWGYGDSEGEGLFVNEAEFVAEFLPHVSSTAGEDLCELVLTGLGRKGWPIFRYRTGDLVRLGASPIQTDNHAFLAGGILGRADDMIVIRGVNIFPGSIENVIRSFDNVAEFRMTAFRNGEMDQLKVEIEMADDDASIATVAEALRRQLGLRIAVESARVGSLPRSDAKSNRFIDRRNTE
jgi:phenylacetate-CoA ligase